MIEVEAYDDIRLARLRNSRQEDITNPYMEELFFNLTRNHPTKYAQKLLSAKGDMSI
jgi:hypothetical protein